MTDTVTLRRIKTLTSHAGHARFLAEVADAPLGTIPDGVRAAHGIPSPYAYSPTWSVLDRDGTPVVIFETRHRRYEVFTVEGPLGPVEEG